MSESWQVEFVSGELCFLSSCNNQHQVRCDLVGKLSLTEEKKGREVWRFVETGSGKVRIFSWMHLFCIVSNQDGQVTTAAIGKVEELELKYPPKGHPRSHRFLAWHFPLPC